MQQDLTVSALEQILDKLDLISADMTEIKLKGKQEEPVPGMDMEAGETPEHEAGETPAFEAKEDAGLVTDEADMSAEGEEEGEEENEENDPKKKLEAIFAKAGK